jgi:hypothetical protein
MACRFEGRTRWGVFMKDHPSELENTSGGNESRLFPVRQGLLVDMPSSSFWRRTAVSACLPHHSRAHMRKRVVGQKIFKACASRDRSAK